MSAAATMAHQRPGRFLPIVLMALLLAAALAGGGSPAAPAAPPSKKQLRWYMGNPAEFETFLLGSNPEQYLNFTGAVSDITGGVYQCCNGETILPNGSLSAYNASSPPWNTTAYAPLDMYKTLVISQNCSASGEPAGCWTAGDTCNNALARVDDFAAELLTWLEAYKMKGLNLVRDSHCSENMPPVNVFRIRPRGRLIDC